MSIRNGKVIGYPLVDFRDTQANIEALTGMVGGETAHATDTGENGYYDEVAAAWVWGGGGGGDTIPIVTSDPGSPTDGEMWKLRETVGAIPDGTAMGALGMTYTGNTGTTAPLVLSIWDDDLGQIGRVEFTYE